MADIMLKSLKFPGLDDKYLIPQIDDTLTQNGKAADAKQTGDRLTALETAIETKAEIDGYYSDLTAGNAEQLVSSIGEEDKVPYNFRTAGGAIDIGDRLTERIVGSTVAWNQLVPTANKSGSYTCPSDTSTYNQIIYSGIEIPVVQGHKMLISAKISRTISGNNFVGISFYDDVPSQTSIGIPITLSNGAADGYAYAIGVISNGIDSVNKITTNNYSGKRAYSAGDTVAYDDLMFIDLTQMFGSTIADYIYSLEQANAGAGVAWFKKLFPKPYYPYNAGELMHVKTSAHKMRGFNAWDEEWESGYYDTADGSKISSNVWSRCKNPIPCVPNTNYYCYFSGSMTGNSGAILFYDASGNYLGCISSGIVNHIITTPDNCRFMKFYHKNAVTSMDVCINLSWDGERDGEYEPYDENVYPLDSDLELRGIPKLDSGNNLYYDGDTYESDGTVTRRYGIVDLGTLNWTKNTLSTVDVGYGFKAIISGYDERNRNRIISFPYTQYSQNGLSNIVAAHGSAIDKVLYNAVSSESAVRIIDSSYSTAEAFKTAMSGVYLVYELATPTTEESDPFINPQIVDDFGTEEYVDERTVPIPVGHETFYAANLKAKLEMAPDSPGDGNGDYVVRQTNGENVYVKLVIPEELPTKPTTDGNYILKCTVASGTPTLTWVSAE